MTLNCLQMLKNWVDMAPALELQINASSNGEKEMYKYTTYLTADNALKVLGVKFMMK